MNALTVQDAISNHGARITVVEKQQEKSEEAIVRVEEKVDGLKTLGITTLVLIVLALVALLGNVLLQPRPLAVAQTIEGGTGKR